jgi:IS1 family transposase
VDQKNAAELAPRNQTLRAPDGSNAASTILELDELWSFVTKKTNQAWFWIALCRQSVKWWSMLSETEVKTLVAACGKPFQQPTVRGTASLISGLPTRGSSQRNSTQQSERKQVKRLMWSAGTIRYDNA